MKQFLTFLTKLKSFWKFYRDYGYDGETAEFIVENYQIVLCNRTKLMSYPTYYARDVIAQIDNWYEEEGYVYIERQYKPKYNYDKFKTILEPQELALLINNVASSTDMTIEKYLEKKCED